MKLTLTIPEDLHTHYSAVADRAHVSIGKAITDRLEAAKDLPFRPIVINAEDRQSLETLVDDQLNTGKDVVEMMKKCLRLSIGDEVEVVMAIDDLVQLEQQAGYYGESLQEFMTRLLPEFVDYTLGRA